MSTGTCSCRGQFCSSSHKMIDLKGNMWIRFTLTAFVLSLMVIACRKKLEDSDIPDVDPVMMYSSEPKLDKLAEAIEEEPDNALLYYKRARIYYEIKALKPAFSDISTAIELDKQQGRFYYLLALIYAESDKKDSAIKMAEKSTLLGVSEPGPYILLSRLYLEAGNKRQAKYFLAEAARRGPFHAEVKFLKGLYKLKEQDTASALAFFSKTVLENPDYPDSYYYLSEIYRSKNQNDSAMIFVLRGLQRSSEKAPLYYVCGEILGELGLPRAKLESYKEAIRDDSLFYPPFLKLGEYYLQENNKLEAEKFLSVYVTNNPTEKKPALLLAGLYEESGEDKKALRLYERIVEVDSEDRKAKEETTRLKEKLEQNTTVISKPDTIKPVPASPAPPVQKTRRTANVKPDSIAKVVKPVQPQVAPKTYSEQSEHQEAVPEEVTPLSEEVPVDKIKPQSPVAEPKPSSQLEEPQAPVQEEKNVGKKNKKKNKNKSQESQP